MKVVANADVRTAASVGKGVVVSYDAPGDDLVLLQDVLEECVNGRTEGHKCPFCREGSLTVKVEESVSVRMECDECRKFFEGRLA